MAYRKTAKALKVEADCERMRNGKARKRMESPAPAYPPVLPDLRKELIITDHDTGETHHVQLFKTGRIDQYRAVIDGKEWKKRIGLSGVLAGIRKSMPRVSAI